MPPSQAAEQPLAVPATFVRDISLPGQGDSILRPSATHYDRFHDEFLVADPGHNRIVVFGSTGTYRFEFSLTGYVSSPRDVTTDPRGYIYVLGTLPGRRALHRFDFDGIPLGEIPLPEVLDGRPLLPRSLACTDDGRLLFLDEAGRRVCTLDADDEVISSFDLTVDLPGDVSSDPGFGPLTVHGDRILVPAAMAGSVMRFSTGGEFIDTIGYHGAVAGTLNFPVAVEVTADGIVLVVDKHRFCIVAYDQTGRYLGEFGGKGYRSGWFYHPTLLAVPQADRVIVGQIFKNRIQVCALPTFIREGAARGAESQAARNKRSAFVSMAGLDPSDTTQRRSPQNRIRFFKRDGTEVLPLSNTASHLEVSE